MRNLRYSILFSALVAVTGITLLIFDQLAASTDEDPKAADTHGWIGTETVKTRFGDFEFKNGYPTQASADSLLDQLKFNRAVEVYLTQMPAVAMWKLNDLEAISK